VFTVNCLLYLLLVYGRYYIMGCVYTTFLVGLVLYNSFTYRCTTYNRKGTMCLQYVFIYVVHNYLIIIIQ